MQEKSDPVAPALRTNDGREIDARPSTSRNAVAAVIGMHRSGTSMATRMVNLAGFDIGDEDHLLPANDFNRTGHWENSRILDINRRLLLHFRGDYLSPPHLTGDWLSDPAVAALEETASGIIASEFADRRSWCFKDPRTTLVVPFWRRAAGVSRFIMLVRNPLDVAASLTERDKISKRQGIALWAIYNLAALSTTSPSERLILHYEDCIARPVPAALNAADFLSDGRVVPDSRQLETIQAYVSKDLKHHSHTPQDLYNDPEIPAEVKDLYWTLRADPVRAGSAAMRSNMREYGAEAFTIAATEAALHWQNQYCDMCSCACETNARLEQARARLHAALNFEFARLAFLLCKDTARRSPVISLAVRAYRRARVGPWFHA